MGIIIKNRIPENILADFEANVKWSLKERINNSFIHTYKPVLDDTSFRSFNIMEEYREWCEDNVSKWLAMEKLFEYRHAKLLSSSFLRNGVKFLFIGKGAAILLGYSDTTRDISENEEEVSIE